ncbi:MAG TPA: AAA family ATPase, partial [Cellulomonas sp.]|nr:AAA family ATPase [Cellulomonas sp.]
ELDEAGYTPDLPRAPRRVPVALDELHVQQVANRALDRCAAGGSTWTVHDIAEHVTRIITESGVRAEQSELREVIAMTARLAAENCFSVLPPGTARPEHVAHLTTVRVVEVDTQLRDLLAARAAQPSSGVPDVQIIARDRGLDEDQAAAAAAVASRDPLVVVEGAAGAGKTTMLGVAIEAAEAEGRASRVVTPTRKAADVAARELGVPADSVAKLVHDHGWRWNSDGVWTRLAVGEVDPGTGRIYTGPPASARLRDGERVVVDEAGMLDQDTAVALLQIADEAGAGLALVGDRAQLPAVGRGGVLDIAAQVSRHTVDMATVHRFTDPEYADLTVQMRRGQNPAAVFDRLHALGLVVLHPSAEDAHAAIARSARDGDAVTTATNDEARVLNASIREVRVRRGEVDDARTAFGNDGLPIGAGDVIQTRTNASRLGVANRQVWTVQQVTEDGGVWAREAAAGRALPRNVRLPADYVTAHTHLAYAATTYGVQSATTPASHTVLSEALDGAGMYVGMTRGRQQNTVHVVAADLDDAREQFAAALQRDRADRGLATATRAAREAVSGLVPDGPVAFVNAERARLRELIRAAEPEAARWEAARDALDQHGASHRAEYDAQARALAEAEAALPRVRAEVVARLIEHATEDGSQCLEAARAAWQAYDALRTSGRFGRAAAHRAYGAAHEAQLKIESATVQRWGGVPPGAHGLAAWATSVAERQARVDPQVVQARENVAGAAQRLHDLTTRHATSLGALCQEVGDAHSPRSVRALAEHWRGTTDEASRSWVRAGGEAEGGADGSGGRAVRGDDPVMQCLVFWGVHHQVGEDVGG